MNRTDLATRPSARVRKEDRGGRRLPAGQRETLRTRVRRGPGEITEQGLACERGHHRVPALAHGVALGGCPLWNGPSPPLQ